MSPNGPQVKVIVDDRSPWANRARSHGSIYPHAGHQPHAQSAYNRIVARHSAGDLGSGGALGGVALLRLSVGHDQNASKAKRRTLADLTIRLAVHW
jgi:hypothetical protein